VYLKLLRRTIGSIKNASARDGIIVVFDANTTNSNFKLSKDYKANRRSFSDDEDSPYLHIQYVKQVLDFLNIKHLEVADVEADDVIASISKDFCLKDTKNRVAIVSADTDFYQLLNKQISVLNLRKGTEFNYISHKCVKEELGVYPNQYVTYKSLVGDSADNIKGVKGVGKITAKRIINREIGFDYLEHKDTLELNTKLITLNPNCKRYWDFRKCRLNFQILRFSNNHIFDRCGF